MGVSGSTAGGGALPVDGGRRGKETGLGELAGFALRLELGEGINHRKGPASTQPLGLGHRETHLVQRGREGEMSKRKYKEKRERKLYM